jgi:hypothetical protein
MAEHKSTCVIMIFLRALLKKVREQVLLRKGSSPLVAFFSASRGFSLSFLATLTCLRRTVLTWQCHLHVIRTYLPPNTTKSRTRNLRITFLQTLSFLVCYYHNVPRLNQLYLYFYDSINLFSINIITSPLNNIKF